MILGARSALTLPRWACHHFTLGPLSIIAKSPRAESLSAFMFNMITPKKSAKP